jgi:LacI family transcriptional regulator
MPTQNDEGKTSGTRPSIRQVADAAGVAMSSVSRVLSGHPDVSLQMRLRVLRAVEELRYKPDFLAQSLRTGATRSVGLSVSDISNPVVAEIARGAEDGLRINGYSMLVMNSDNDPFRDEEHIRVLASRRVDGLILSVANERKRGTIDALADLDIPVVVLDRDLPKRVRASAVHSNHRPGMEAAVGHLLDMGHRRIGLLSWPLDLRPGRERLAGLKDAYAARNLHDESTVAPGLMSAEQAEIATDTLMDANNPPTAVIAGSNQILIGCLRALHRRRVRVGPDLSLVTCDNVPLAELHAPPIATIARDNIETGRRAAQLLLRRLTGVSDPEVSIVETTFIPRASCTSPSATSHLVPAIPR